MAIFGRKGNGRNGEGDRPSKRPSWGELDTAFGRLAELELSRRADEQDDRKHYATCPLCTCPDGLTITEAKRYAPVQIRCSNGCDARQVRTALGLIPDAALARRLHEGPEQALTQVNPAASNGASAREDDTADPDPWPPLLGTLPAFPVDALPEPMARMAQATAEATQTPVDLPGLAALGVLSSAALGPIEIDCRFWREESLGQYTLIPMESGDRKSQVLKALAAPLRDVERELEEQSRRPRRERERSREFRMGRQANLMKVLAAAQDAETRERAEAELTQLDCELEEIGGEPAAPRMLADDTTPERLGGLLAKHGECMSIISAESALLDNLTGRYSEKGTANLHLVCKAYTAEATRIDRSNRSELLEHPRLAITLTPQPHVLDALVNHEVARRQGFVARFAIALPRSLQGKRRQTPQTVPPDVRRGWEEMVRHVSAANPLTLLTKNGDWPIFVSSVSSSLRTQIDSLLLLLTLSDEASALLTEMRKELEPRLGPDGDLVTIRDWVARHHGRIARFAGALHLAEEDPAVPISGATMRRALRIGEYLLAHAVAALSVREQLLRSTLAWLAAREESTVTQRQLHRGPLNGRGDADLAAALATRLVKLGALRPLDDAGGGRGRPSARFEINPHLRSEGPSPREDWWRAVEADGEPELAGEGPTVEDLAVLSRNGAASS